MEQIKLGNENLYELAVGGISEKDGEKLQIIIVQNDSNFQQVENDFEQEYNTQRIEILDNSGEIMDVKKGYTYLESIKKQNNYVIGQEELLSDDSEVYYSDIISTVFILSLSKPDSREQVKNLQETVDMLVLSELGE